MPTDWKADAVAADMERALKPLIAHAQDAAPYHRRAIDRQRRRFGRGWRRATLVAPAAAVLLVTGALAVGYDRFDRPVPRTAEVALAAPLPPTSVQLGTSSSVSTRPAPAAPASAVPVADAAPPPTIESRSPVKESALAEPSTASAPDSRPAVARRSPPVARPRPVAKSKPAITADRRRKRSARSCEPDSLERHCVYQDVLRADARLRSAYAAARRDGVPTSILSDINKRWRKSRKDADEHPDRVIQHYEKLADSLDGERRVVTQ